MRGSVGWFITLHQRQSIETPKRSPKIKEDRKVKEDWPKNEEAMEGRVTTIAHRVLMTSAGVPTVAATSPATALERACNTGPSSTPFDAIHCFAASYLRTKKQQEQLCCVSESLRYFCWTCMNKC